MIRELREKKVHSRYILVNQVLPTAFRSLGSSNAPLLSSLPEVFREAATLSEARARIQQKYLQQLADALDQHTIIRMPLLESEPRGLAALEQFAENLTEPCARLQESGGSARLSDAVMQETLRKLQEELNGHRELPPSVATPPPIVPPVNVQVQVLSLLAKPNGIQQLLDHEEVKRACLTDANLDALFRDLKNGGMLAAFSHLGNPGVRDGLVRLLPLVQDLFHN